MPATDVPNFVHLGGDDRKEYMRLTREWLADRGLGFFETYCSAGWQLDKLLEIFTRDSPTVPVIVCGAARTNPADNHAVVAMGGKIVHDPSGCGVCGPCVCDCGQEGCDGVGYWWLYVIAFAAHSNLQPMAA